MGQNHDPDEKSSNGEASPRLTSVRSAANPPVRNQLRPQYMTVGSGSTSASAAALMASLDNDSGYGTSIAGDRDTGDNYTNDGGTRGWHPGLTIDRPTPIHTPPSFRDGDPAADSERRIRASNIHQQYYNQNRATLGRAITQTVETLKDLQRKNSTWPAQYPPAPSSEPLAERPASRPGFTHTQSTVATTNFQYQPDNSLVRPGPRRAATSLGEDTAAESSSSSDIKKTQEPERLITPQAEQTFSILKLELKVQGLTQSDIAHSINRKSIASLLDGKINQSIRHLLLLRDRLEDTSSKVLVTGDLNAGKSTFCNALLRRKVLPEDQQPCTSIFCEVLDVRENGGVEEAHAVHKETQYNRNDESTYDVYSLHELEKVVTDNDRYTQCKIYVKDTRAIDQSLLNNGVVDISIIDAPGLNSDSLKTTAVFARQEEIDVVVFVVSAANHFTLSAKEFIWSAAQEKAYLFIVVNGFDNIRDKERCQRMILEQVANLSPRTFKESSELVHFVSSNAIPVAPAVSVGSGANGSGGAGGSGFDPSDDSPPPKDDDDDLGKRGEPGSPPGKYKGKDKEKVQDFEELEGALRRFVLDKRARSKLAPARTYLLKILTDLNILSVVNRDIAQSELDRVNSELEELEPKYEKSKEARTAVSEEIDKTIEDACSNIYSHTSTSLTTVISSVGDVDLGVPYPGLLSAYQYAEDIKAAMLDQISAAVASCEDYARTQTASGVNTIQALSTLHLPDEHPDLSFQSDKMFQRRRDALARQVDTSIEFWDFFNVASLWERQEKVAGTGMAMTVVGVVGGRMMGGIGWIDGALGAARVVGTRSLRRLIVPGIIATSTPASFPLALEQLTSSHYSLPDNHLPPLLPPSHPSPPPFPPYSNHSILPQLHPHQRPPPLRRSPQDPSIPRYRPTYRAPSQNGRPSAHPRRYPHHPHRERRRPQVFLKSSS